METQTEHGNGKLEVQGGGTGKALTSPGKVAVPGLEALQQRDLVVPNLRIGQGQTKEKGVVKGKLYNSLDPSDQRDQVRLVALAFRHGQVLFPKDEQGKPVFDAPVTCQSLDGFVPSPRIEKPISTACRNARGEPLCPASKWTKDGKPACQETHVYVVVDVETGAPYRLSLKSTDISTSRRFLSVIAIKARIGQRALYDFEFTLATEEQSARGNTWYGAVFKDIREVEKKGTHRDAFEQYGGVVHEDDDGGDQPEVPAAASGAPAAEKKPAEKSAKGREMDF